MADTYRQAGVDIEAADEAINRIKPAVASTKIPGVMGGIGGFGGLFDLAAAGLGADTVLVSGADGVGTKLKIAFASGRHDTIGIDCVAMCVNDILTLGARPLFFLDYLAVGRLEPGVVEAVVEGVAEGCRRSGCALLGGETAEMPGMYAEGEYDLAGFAVGGVERGRIIDGHRIAAGDVVIGLPSSGFHSNGYSLLRALIFERHHLPLTHVPDGMTRPVSEILLEPTRIYVSSVAPLLAAEPALVKAMVHVTGGGLIENVPRVLPAGLGVRFDQGALDALERPEFRWLAGLGQISAREMYTVFNMGVGFVLITEAAVASDVVRQIEGARLVGEVVAQTQLGGEGRTEIPRCGQ